MRSTKSVKYVKINDSLYLMLVIYTNEKFCEWLNDEILIKALNEIKKFLKPKLITEHEQNENQLDTYRSKSKL